jgi:hypothetical protein
MLPPVRRMAAHCIRSLVLLILGLLGGAGCSHPPLLAAPHRYVRLDALLPLHPSWAQIRSLDREIARLKTAPAQSGEFHYQPHPGMPVIVPRAVTPANMAAQRAAQVDRDATRYVESLRKSLDEANQATMSLARRREQRRVEAAVAARLAEAGKNLRNENEVRSFAILQRLRDLTFKDIVVRSRIQDLAQAHSRDTRLLRDAQSEHAGNLAEMERLRTENRDLLAQDVSRITARLRDKFYAEEEAQAKERLAKREEELGMEKLDKLTAAMRQQRNTAIPAPVAPELPAVDPHATPLPLPIEPATTLVTSRSHVQSALNVQAAVWQIQRTSLVDEIRADTRKAVQQVALRRGWKLVEGPAPGAVDGTDEAADDLRQQWRIGKGP